MAETNELNKKIEQAVIEAAIEVVRKREGALFVIGNDIKYEKLIKQEFKTFNILEEGARKILVGLAMIDGAVIIDLEGNVTDYGVMIKNTRAYVGYGTRHAAAVTASKKGRTSILCSEEELKIKIFKDGKYIMKIDALEKGIEKEARGIAKMLETIGVGFVGTMGVGVLAPTLGITLLPGVVIFGGSYYAIRKMFDKFKKK